MVDHARAVRLGARIHEIVAEALRREVKDPRLETVTVTGVKVSGDLREAKLTYTVRGDEEVRGEVEHALTSARGTLRRIVGEETGIRYTPELSFEREAGDEEAEALEELLARAREADARVRAVAQGARPAGGEDPYRR